MWYIALLFVVVTCFQAIYAGTFSVDYTNHQFVKDGQPFRYISGSIHYMRVHPDYWNDRLQRIRALGLNAVQVYVPWNLHEPTPGNFDFYGILNITNFITLAQQNGLNVLLRPGPYICAEWEYGGLPYWLLKYENIKLRTSDVNYTNAVQKYYNVLLDVIKPLLYKNGGPILMVQVENEYGVMGVCDHNYTGFLRDLIWSKLGNDVVLYTTDPGNDHAQSCGHVDGVVSTVDFGPTSDGGIDNHFALQQRYANGGPKVCSEFWVDWFCSWGVGLRTLSEQAVADNVYHMYHVNNASFNIYMIHGGTNFGFMAGPNIITSYDYGAAVKENGATNLYYTAIHDMIQNISGWPNPPQAIPADPPVSNYGPVALTRVGQGLIQTLSQILEACQSAPDPLSYEQLDHPYGYVLYTTTLGAGGKTLSTPNIKDFGYVFVNNVYQGMTTGNTVTFSSSANSGDTLRILVEHHGRTNYWTSMYPSLEFKGLFGNVSLDGAPLKNWFACGVNLTEASVNSLTNSNFEQAPHQIGAATSQPGVYVGYFNASTLTDTWFDSTGWGKGQLFVNGFNLGRYWPSKGPQITLYVPKPVLKPQNTVLLIELIGGQQATANFVNQTIGHYN